MKSLKSRPLCLPQSLIDGLLLLSEAIQLVGDTSASGWSHYWCFVTRCHCMHVGFASPFCCWSCKCGGNEYFMSQLLLEFWRHFKIDFSMEQRTDRQACAPLPPHPRLSNVFLFCQQGSGPKPVSSSYATAWMLSCLEISFATQTIVHCFQNQPLSNSQNRSRKQPIFFFKHVTWMASRQLTIVFVLPGNHLLGPFHYTHFCWHCNIAKSHENSQLSFAYSIVVDCSPRSRTAIPIFRAAVSTRKPSQSLGLLTFPNGRKEWGLSSAPPLTSQPDIPPAAPPSWQLDVILS